MPKTPTTSAIASYHPKSRSEWRAWLEKNHATSAGVWFVYNKKETGKARVSYDEAVEEALCFGWIDSAQRVLDAERTALRFSPRKEKSGWSKVNKERVGRLIKLGLMTPAGLAKIEAAKRDGSWRALDAVERLTIPPDLKAALAVNPDAERNFEDFAPSDRKVLLKWIATAKRPETRAQRVAEVVRRAEARNAKGGRS